jgi:hypothetical protein
MLKAGVQPSTITHSILVKLYKGAGYGQQSPEAVAVLYQHHGLQPHVVGLRRRRRENFAGRAAGGGGMRSNINVHYEAQNLSPHNTLMHSAGSDPSGTASLCSSPESTPSMQHAGHSWDHGGSFSVIQPYIQNHQMQPSGSWMIMGPYPAPAHNAFSSPMENVYNKPKSKAIIKI